MRSDFLSQRRVLFFLAVPPEDGRDNNGSVEADHHFADKLKAGI